MPIGGFDCLPEAVGFWPLALSEMKISFIIMSFVLNDKYYSGCDSNIWNYKS
jgi:hypothetical protein